MVEFVWRLILQICNLKYDVKVNLSVQKFVSGNSPFTQTKSLSWIHMGKPSETDSLAYFLEGPTPPDAPRKPSG